MGKSLPKKINTEIPSRLPNDHDSSAGKVCFIFQLPVPVEFVVAQNVKRLYYAEFDKTNEKIVRVKDLDLTHEDANNGYDDERIHPHDRWGDEPWEIPVNNEIKHYEEIVGSCNGLVCITLSYNLKEELFYKPLYVCNPMTRECVVLPEIIVQIDDDDDDDDDEPYSNDNDVGGGKGENILKYFNDKDVEKWGGNFCDGFGYNPSTKEYKVVRIYNVEVYVYTLGDGKGWRHIGTKEYKSGIGEYIHGAYNWLDKDRNLVTFDLEDEKFGVLLSPPCFRDWGQYSYELRQDGESLSIVHKNQSDAYDIWLLEKNELEKCESNKDKQDYQQSWRWTKKCTIYDDRDPSQKSNKKKPKPFAITKDNEVLFHDDRFFYRHDLKTRTSYPLVGFKKCSRWSIFKAVRHANSLVSLKDLGEKDTKMLTQDKIIVQRSLVPELTYNIALEETKKRKERTEGHQCWPYVAGWKDDMGDFSYEFR